ncbi:AMP-dependent synthetase [Helicobacter sp. 13S00482-2]|uniref:ANL family adenylate-forming protein n=1 Tax=Helicobacter sp. 13S00482-2 TaxID=1476200 RepID=UPI000BA777B1|nr:fatty acid--CoA ligase family protein [Helicobacter sp. 13S00482-2]PAF53676.1 AMP-dependent synthetase [Helicobacter sp. 13S00482-2]
MANFTHFFLKKLDSFSKDRKALIYENTTYNYEDLIQNILYKIKKLEKFPEGSIIGIIGDYDIDNISMLLACIEKRFIVVPFVNNDEISNKLHEGQVDFLYYQDNIKTLSPPFPKHQILQDLKKLTKSGLILFSSGSTGKPKAIVHNLDNLLNSYMNKNSKTMNILLFLMFDHIGGLNTLFHTLSIGACGIAIKERKDIYLLAKTIQKYQISLLPASPSLLNLVLLSDVSSYLDCVKIITYGTESMPDSLLLRLKKTFPKVKFHQTFGTTEVGIAQTKTSENTFKLEGMEYKIKNGELWIKSKTQTLGYINADNSVFDNDGFFATGDLVEVTYKDNQEYLKIIGRSKEIINVGGEKVSPQEIENTILQINGIQDCIVYGEYNPITGQSITTEVVIDNNILPNDKMELKKIIREFCKNSLPKYKIPTKVILMETLNLGTRFKKSRLNKTS